MCDTKVGISYSSVYFNVITMLSLAKNVLYPCMVRDEHLHLFVLYSYQSSYHLLNNHINVFLYYLCLLIFLSFFPSFLLSFNLSFFQSFFIFLLAFYHSYQSKSRSWRRWRDWQWQWRWRYRRQYVIHSVAHDCSYSIHICIYFEWFVLYSV